MIARMQKQYASAGVGSYDEGCHDDVNKHVWLATFWGCDDTDGTTATAATDAAAAGNASHTCQDDAVLGRWLLEYAQFHMSPALAQDVVKLIWALEEDWARHCTVPCRAVV
jgi:hypothetical protein